MRKNYISEGKLKSYAALAGVFILGRQAEAQVVYTDVDPDDTIHIGNFEPIDLNNDGTKDFDLIILSTTGTLVMDAGVYHSNGIAGYIKTYFGYPAQLASVLNEADPIDASLNWLSTSGTGVNVVLWASLAVIGSFGPWDNITNKYVGLRIKVSSDYYYGWARLDVSHNHIILKDYAYNSTPNEAINVAETAIESPGNDFNPTVYAYDHGLHIQLPNDVLHASADIFDMAGNRVFSASINGSGNILMNNFATGNYIIRLNDEARIFSMEFELK